MKSTSLLLLVGGFLLAGLAAPSFGGSPREIVFKTEFKNGVTSWAPAETEVKRGEKVKFVVKHDLPEGFPTHGFSIPALHIAKQVDRGKPLVVEATIPDSLEPKAYEVGCQLHPKHAGAKLLVK